MTLTLLNNLYSRKDTVHVMDAQGVSGARHILAVQSRLWHEPHDEASARRPVQTCGGTKGFPLATGLLYHFRRSDFGDVRVPSGEPPKLKGI